MASITEGIDALSPEERRHLLEKLLAEKRRKPRTFPVSFAQQRLWFFDQLVPRSSLYNIAGGVRLEGPLDLPALARALEEIVRRHAVLRTTFAMVKGQPVSVVQPAPGVRVPLVDLASVSRTAAEEEVERLRRDEAARPFDLRTGPLVRFRVLRLASGVHEALLSLHHIASDGWSLGVLVTELAVLYGAFSEGKPSPLSELAIQYADFAHWQRNWLSGEILEEQLSYWKKELAGLTALQLPTDRPRPLMPSFRGSAVSFELPRELAAGIGTLSRQEGATLFMVVLAAFQVLLARYSGQNDVAVGTPVANRNRPEVEPLIGFFVNTLVMRADVSGSPPFRDLLRRVRDVALQAYAHQDLPFEKLVEELKPDRDLSRSPVFQVVLALQNAPMPALELPRGLTLAASPVKTRTAKFELTMYLGESDERVTGELEYATDLFDDTTARRMAAHFRSLVENIVADPEASVSELSLMSAAERHEVLVEWNATKVEALAAGSVLQWFETQAETRADALAIASGERHLSYGELNRRARRLSRRLLDAGIHLEGKAGIALPPSPEMVIAVLATFKAGGAYVPLDPESPEERLSFAVRDARLRTLVTERPFVEKLSVYGKPVVTFDGLGVDDGCIVPDRTVDPENLAYVIYTSGSTGRPKGVEVRQAGLSNLVLWHRAEYDVSPRDRATQVADPVFDASVWEVWPYLTAGASLHIAPETVRSSPSHLMEWLAAEAITLSFLSTPLAESVLEESWPRALALRAVLTGGDKLHRGPRRVLPFRLVNHYGPTENTVVTSSGAVPSYHESALPPSIGRPLSRVSVYLSSRELTPSPIGIPGELLVGGASLARGYLDRPALTAEKFVPDFFGEPGQRLYRTGDLARWLADGNIEFLGRIDHQVKVRGHRIELGEIESALREHVRVHEAAVTSFERAPGDTSLAAYVVLDELGEGDDGSESAGIAEIRRFLGGKIPDYMIPARFTVMDRLPRTPSGKVDRKLLPVPDRTRPRVDNEFVAPGTAVEARLAELWSEVLGVERVGVTDNFFELGGHSLLATQLVSRIRGAFEVELPLSELFRAPTIASLAEAIALRTRSSGAGSIPRAPRDQPLPLSFAQQRLWFIDQLVPGNPFYIVAGAVRLTGSLQIGLLRRTLQEIVRRHEALRTTFLAVDGRAIQVIASSIDLPMALIDLSEVADPESPGLIELTNLIRLIRAIAAENAAHPFDLRRGPLLRVSLLRLSEEDHVVLLTIHHIVSDGWSMGVLIQEISQIYGAFLTEKPSPLPELPVQYADFAHWQREWFQGEVLKEQLSYWKERLEGLTPLRLPTDRPRPAVQTYAGGKRSIAIGADLTNALRVLSNREGCTLFMTLLAGFQLLLSRYSHQKDIVLGCPIANRTHAEIEGLIGFFVNSMVVRTGLEGDPSFRELLARVRKVALGAFAHQDLPFEKLVEEIQPERDLGREPIFQVMFTLQNAPMPALDVPGGLRLSPVNVETATAKFDLTMFLWEDRDGLGGSLEYSTDLYDGSTIERLLQHYQTLLEGAVQSPESRLSRLALLTEAERHQLLVELPATESMYPSRASIGDLFDLRAEALRDAVAAVYGEEHLTYGELATRSNRLANHLRERGIGGEEPVGVLLQRSTTMVVGLLGIVKAGGAYLPLDPSYPEERLSYMFEDAQARVVLTQEWLATKVPAKASGEPLCLDRDWPAIAKASSAGPKREWSPGGDGLAYIIYTSGSTGRSKGVAVSHRAIERLVFNTNYIELRRDSRVAQASTSTFDAATFEIWGSLLHGARLIGIQKEELLSPSLLAARLREEAVSTIFVTTSLFNQLLSEEPFLFDTVEQVLFGGEAANVGLVREAARRGSPRRLLHVYGPTETTTFASWTRVDSVREGATSIPIGRAIANTELYVLDENLEPVPMGVDGELYIGGAGLARFYWNRPRLTAEKFVPHPFGEEEDGSRLYRTGDLCRLLPDGRVDFLGRVDHQVKLRGFRIDLGEVESELTAHAAVRSAVAQVHKDATGQRRLIGYVVPEPGFLGRAADGADFQPERVERWQEVYDRVIYSDVSRPVEEPTFNIAGWRSSYTGESLGDAAMREQVEQTVGRILALAPRRVLEIGCGTGLLLFPIAPHTQVYWGTDFSQVALDYVEKVLEASPIEGVRLSKREADDFQGIEPGSFDTVVLNSVVQYFPGIEYFTRILEGAARALKPGGRIFIGDVRNFGLLELFETGVALHQASEQAGKPELWRKVRHQIDQGQELLIDPSFFWHIGREIEGLRALAVQLKRGGERNELTQFRYDVVLEVVRERAPASEEAVAFRDWTRTSSVADVGRLLEEEKPALFGVAGVPNRRVWGPLRAYQHLTDPGESETAKDLRKVWQEDGGIDPEAFWSLGEKLGYEVRIPWSEWGEAGSFDVLFRRLGSGEGPWVAQPRPGRTLEARREPASRPLRAMATQKLVPELRAWLEERLPEYMVPTSFVVLDGLPLSPSGKVDRAALPAPDLAPRDLRERYEAPRTPIEEKLAKVWSEVLGVERVGLHDNFFELGGDSILSIQVVSRARRAGIELSPRQLFQNQTIGDLARVVEALPEVASEQGPVVGSAPLTPIQRWFFQQELPERHHFNQSLLFEVSGLQPEKLLSVVKALVEHHDALRLRFVQDEAGEWRQRIADPGEGGHEALFRCHELIDLEGDAFRNALETEADNLQRSLDLENGPLVRIALFRGKREERLSIVIHHLAVDGVSWRILIEDLWSGYQQAKLGRDIDLGPKTTSYRRWAEELSKFALSDELKEETIFWRRQAHPGAERLPGDRDAGPNDVASMDTVEVALTQEETRLLLQEVPHAYRTRINDVLLAALVRGFSTWTGSSSLLLDLEGHGREDLFERIDLSRTVGWFTAMFPVRLTLEGVEGPGESLKRIKEQLRAIPRGGVGYGVLRYLKGEEGLASSPEVGFNYFGQLDNVLPPGLSMRLASESGGPMMSSRGERAHSLEVSAAVASGRLQLSWIYSRNRHDRGTIERLAGEYLRALRELIDHCASEEAGGCTPSDFPLVNLDQATLDAVVGRGRDVEDLYPLSPLQSGLLFHSLTAPEAGLYLEQLGCRLTGDLSPDHFRRAWERVVERHPILRTAFRWDRLSEPVQVVHRRAALPWKELDWRELSPGEQRARIQTLQDAERRGGLNLSEPPLMRMTLIRLSGDTWRFLWSHHHLLLDGWSLPLVMKEVVLLYEGYLRGHEIPLPVAPPYREYIAWWMRQDFAEAEDYWRKRLSGFTMPTPLPFERDSSQVVDEKTRAGERKLQLSRSTTTALERLARREQLTLNTILQGAWALLLSRYSGEKDIVYGTVSSGRSASIANIESMVGLFINTLPVRVRIDGESQLLPWLAELNQQLVQLQHYEHTPLARVVQSSEMPRGVALFESLFVFENYPVDSALRRPQGTLRVSDPQLSERGNHQLGVLAGPGEELEVRICYDRIRFADSVMTRVAEHLKTLLEGIADDPRRRLSELPMLSEAERGRLAPTEGSIEEVIL